MSALAERNFKWQAWLGADFLCVVFLVVICLSIGLPRFRCGLDFTDEGVLAYGAERVTEGQMPNRDFVSLQPPFSFYTVAAAFKLFGKSLLSLRIFCLIIYVLIPLFVYGIARNVTTKPLALAAAIPTTTLGIPFSYFGPFAAWQGITAALVAAFIYLRAILGGHSLLGLPAGIMTAFSVFLRHDQGLYLLIGIVALTLDLRLAKETAIPPRKLKSAFGWWVIGASVVILPCIVYWWLEGALPDMFKQLIIFPHAIYSKTSSLPFPKFSSQLPFREIVFTSLYYILPALVVIVAVWLSRTIVTSRFRQMEAMIAFLLLWSGLFYCQVITRSDAHHLLITLPPFWILAAACWTVFLKKLGSLVDQRTSSHWLQRSSKAVGAIIPAAVAFWLIWILAPFCLPDVSKATELVALERGGVRMEAGQLVTEGVRIIQSYAPADRSILCLPYEPMLYFLCERRNPTRWNYLWPGDQTPREHQEMIQQARSDPPAAMLIIEGKPDVRLCAGAVLDYVNAEYEHAGDLGSIRIYLPRTR